MSYKREAIESCVIITLESREMFLWHSISQLSNMMALATPGATMCSALRRCMSGLYFVVPIFKVPSTEEHVCYVVQLEMSVGAVGIGVVFSTPASECSLACAARAFVLCGH